MRSLLHRFPVPFLLATLVSGCASSVPPPQAAGASKPAAPTPLPKPAKERLLALLRTAPRPRPCSSSCQKQLKARSTRV
jgi:hypothetical protein